MSALQVATLAEVVALKNKPGGPHVGPFSVNTAPQVSLTSSVLTTLVQLTGRRRILFGRVVFGFGASDVEARLTIDGTAITLIPEKKGLGKEPYYNAGYYQGSTNYYQTHELPPDFIVENEFRLSAFSTYGTSTSPAVWVAHTPA